MKHPNQPLYRDDRNVLRFKQNHIVRFLLDHGPHDLNSLARMNFEREDRVQFAQLIGYSLSGFGDLGYDCSESEDCSTNANKEKN